MMNKKRNSFACLLAASVVVIPAFVLSGCEQNEGLGEFGTEYTLSERMMRASGDVGDFTDPYIKKFSDAVPISYGGYKLGEFSISWGANYWNDVTVSAHVRQTSSPEDTGYILQGTPDGMIQMQGNLEVSGSYHYYVKDTLGNLKFTGNGEFCYFGEVDTTVPPLH